MSSNIEPRGIPVEAHKPADLEHQTRVVERLKGKMLNEGQPLALSCRIHASPAPVNFYWEKDGHLLQSDGDNIVIGRKNDYQSLYIPNVTVDHGGIYKCTGESANGSRAVTAAEVCSVFFSTEVVSFMSFAKKTAM